MSKITIDPITRLEGHGKIEIFLNGDGAVENAYLQIPELRGFEKFSEGRPAEDMPQITQRICGVCPVPHGMTSTYAVDAALGYSRSHITFAGTTGYGVPKKAVLIRNLVLSAEFLMSHLTHFYHLVVLDYVQGPTTPPWTPFFDNSVNGLHFAL